jgi:hypothetical protein
MKRPTRLKNLAVDEISVVDRAAGVGTKIMMRKSNQTAETPTMTITDDDARLPEAVTKAVLAGKLTKQTLAAELNERAMLRKRDGETVQQAYVRLFVGSDDGIGQQMLATLRKLEYATAGLDGDSALAKRATAVVLGATE